MVEDLSYQVERKRIKNIYIRVLPDGTVKVTAPKQVSDRTIEEFVRSKREWILAARKKLLAQPLHQTYTYESGEKHLLWGKEYPLEVVYTKGKPHASLQGEALLLEVPADGDTALRQKLIEDLYRRQLKAKVPLLMEKYSAIVGKAPDSWGVKNMKTRWGTCNTTDKRIWLNLQLAKYEPECLEYVIVHELVHFYERGHNAVFYGYLDQFYPDWKAVRKKLKG